jgi:hypothetical protein
MSFAALRRCVKKGLQDLSREINSDGKSKGVSPMFKVSMLLKDGSGIVFSPTMPELAVIVSDTAKGGRECVSVIPRLAETLESARVVMEAPRGVQFDDPGSEQKASPLPAERASKSYSPKGSKDGDKVPAATSAADTASYRSFYAIICKDEEINKVELTVKTKARFFKHLKYSWYI